ncbi:hypothetical protein ACF0H5_004900 [Mactra antiquata]
MATSNLTESEKCSDVNVSLSSLIKTEQFPFIIKVNESYEIARTFGVANGTKILIQSLLCPEFAIVRPLGRNNKSIGATSDQENSKVEGNVYLIPTKCNGQVKFISMPDDCESYSSIEEVIQHSPVYVKTEEDVIITSSQGADSSFAIPKNTVLKLVRKFIQDNESWLEFSHGKKSYVFHHNEHVKLRSVEDNKLYNLYELSRIQLLPRVIQFQECEQINVQYLDYSMNEEMTSVLKMPLQLLGFVNVKLLVGWVRDRPRRTYETVIIHNQIWDDFIVQKHSVKDKMKYIKRKYGQETDLDFVEKTMLIMPLRCTKLLWLGSPKLFKRNESSQFKLETINTHFEDSTNENDDSVEEVETDVSQKSLPRTVELPKVKLKRSLFAKVHAEILRWFRSKEPFIRNKPPRKSVEQKERHTAPIDLDRQSLRHQISRFKTIPRDKSTKMDESTTNGKEFDIWKSSTAKHLPDRTCRSFFDISMEPKVDEHSDIPRLCVTPFSTRSVKQDDDETSEASVSLQEHLRMEVDIDPKIMKKDSTAEDFYTFSVAQTALCFRLCALCRFADYCYTNRLDGMFFKNLNFDILKDSPFYLNSIQILKVDRIINQGWRPFNE